MTHTYQIGGMTCGSCVARVKSEILKLGDISSAEVSLHSPQATITMSRHIPVQELQLAIKKAGKYTIAEDRDTITDRPADSLGAKSTYWPVYLIFGFLILLTLLIPVLKGSFNLEQSMMQFMGGFFISFSFFKFLDLRGFADSYSSYDLVARAWRGWGYWYAFIELILGISFLVGYNPFLTNAVTLVVMSISIVGVFQSVLSKKKIRCACLGTVFNLPMSRLTIIEDALMIVMSFTMLMI